MKYPKLEDIFAGRVELTASERAYLSHALEDLYLSGSFFGSESRLEIARRVASKLNALKLEKMVTPDGTRLVTVEEHDRIVADIEEFERSG